MEQYTDNQYDDDLTLGADEYGDTFQTSDIDLFEFADDDESPISRLRTLVLSIDWEITDEVLMQFNEEILDLKDVWADDKIRMIYLQALEKISRYIYRDKSDSHPNAIKLLLSMYYNLEKIVLSEDLREEEVKPLLFSDVRKFEKLKKLIAQSEAALEANADKNQNDVRSEVKNADVDQEHDLTALKAIVLGIDWEITEKDLLELREEVMRLEEKFANSKPKLVFLQGIGTVGAYIRKKKSDAHADAFKLLHSFYDGLEKIVRSPMSLEEEKAVLYPEVEKFNKFKTVIAPSMAPDMVSEDEEEPSSYEPGSDIAPAFADYAEDEVRGFQEDEEAAALSGESAVQVDSHIDNFFGEEEEKNVEPEKEPEVVVAKGEVEDAEALSDAFFDFDDSESQATIEVDKETALRGVDVETEADDDSDEDALPEVAGEVAPALLDTRDQSIFSEVSLEGAAPEEQLSDEVTGRLDAFFTDGDDEVVETEESPAFSVSADVALQGVDVESEGDEDEEEGEPLSPVAAFTDDDIFADDDVTESEDDFDAPAAVSFDSSAEALATVSTEEDISSDDLFGDLEESLEQSFDEIMTEPVDDDEIELAIGDGDEATGPGIEDDSVAAALQDLEQMQELEDDITPAPEEAAVAEQFDALFGNGDSGNQEEEDDVIFTLDEEIDSIEPEPALVEVEANVIEDVAAEIEEEDIVAAFPEDEQPVTFEVEVEGEDKDESGSETFGLFEEDGDNAPEIAMDGLDEGDVAAAVSAVDVSEEREVAAETDTADTDDGTGEYREIFTVRDGDVETVAEERIVESQSAVSNLVDCVESLGVEINDSVIEGLFAELDVLSEKWLTNPVEKSYLQLISTVAKHVDDYRYEANEKAHGLLKQLAHGLKIGSSEETDYQEKLEKLFLDTNQVLEWQQAMLNSLAVTNEDGKLSFTQPSSAPVEEVQLGDDFTEELETAMSVEDAFVDEMGDIDTFVPEGDETVDAELEDVLSREVMSGTSLTEVNVPDSAVTDIVRQEIDSLRKTLQQEIAELRSAIKGKED
ncbi:hypothetical protein [Desulfopila sp. IMCC35008]|uniref:hypothetical protein n=1 Tax=Desulfopila sp. IMCC35008 TaxID=2653858 RepID=UPI0013D70DF1|nr:hypothetical protein [Desulfopila sp. IMCC35008]